MSNKKIRSLGLFGVGCIGITSIAIDAYYDNNVDEIHASPPFARLEQIAYETGRSQGLIDEHIDESLGRSDDAPAFRDCVSDLPINELVDSYISLQREAEQIRASPAYAALRDRESQVEDDVGGAYLLTSILALAVVGAAVYLVGKSPKDKNAQKTPREEPKK